MKFTILIDPQTGIGYSDQLRVAQVAERAGFECFFRSDHYESFPGADDLATTDAWTTLAGIARETESIRLGVLVSPVTFRLPGPFAKVVTTLDEMSNGRVEVGVGTGWHAGEHARLGIPYPSISERAQMLEETLSILHGLWDEADGWSSPGPRWPVEDALFRPKPIQQPHPPILVGGKGSSRSVRIAARYADEFNLTTAKRTEVVRWYANLDEACIEIGRDPGSIRRSVLVGILIGSDAEELERREAKIVAGFPSKAEGNAWLAENKPTWIVGTPAEARAQIAELEALGVERLMLLHHLPRDLEMIDLLGRDVLTRG